MPVTIMRISNFEAKPGGGGDLEALLGDVLPAMKTAKGFHSYEIVQDIDASDHIAVTEIWDSVEDHKAAAGNISPDDFKRVMALMAGPPSGAYYHNKNS